MRIYIEVKKHISDSITNVLDDLNIFREYRALLNNKKSHFIYTPKKVGFLLTKDSLLQ